MDNVQRHFRFRALAPESKQLVYDMMKELKNDGAETPQWKRQHPRRKHETV
jgi:hypothetical protein